MNKNKNGSQVFDCVIYFIISMGGVLTSHFFWFFRSEINLNVSKILSLKLPKYLIQIDSASCDKMFVIYRQAQTISRRRLTFWITRKIYYYHFREILNISFLNDLLYFDSFETFVHTLFWLSRATKQSLYVRSSVAQSEPRNSFFLVSWSGLSGFALLSRIGWRAARGLTLI